MILDVGVDIIMGFYFYCLESVEKYKDKYIVYSMGDFVFGVDFMLFFCMILMF